MLSQYSWRPGLSLATLPALKDGGRGCLLLAAFGRAGLSAASRGKFECYNWMGDGLDAELRAAIAASTARKDLHLLAIDADGNVIGYVFLWATSEHGKCLVPIQTLRTLLCMRPKCLIQCRLLGNAYASCNL